MKFVIIDESGRLADRNDKFLVFAAIVADSLVGLDKIIPSVKKSSPKTLNLSEVKFSTTGDKTRIKVLKLIVKKGLKLFVLVINKEGRKIDDNPNNYALLVSILLLDILKKMSSASHVIIDRHFTWVTQREKFNDLLQEFVDKPLFIEHLDSQQNTIVSLPDFVAGAFHLMQTKDDARFTAIIDPQVEVNATTWKQLRQQKR
ncbi:DUF3800 domain-containing protein [Candidatus Microgenomates bacterium]|nr:DUF3800 domain-containing protein [Candidatus Microgenomates bacterium]